MTRWVCETKSLVLGSSVESVGQEHVQSKYIRVNSALGENHTKIHSTNPNWCKAAHYSQAMDNDATLLYTCPACVNPASSSSTAPVTRVQYAIDAANAAYDPVVIWNHTSGVCLNIASRARGFRVQKWHSWRCPSGFPKWFPHPPIIMFGPLRVRR